MARTVWDYYASPMAESSRAYETLEVIISYSTSWGAESTPLNLDPETGLVVHDVFAYEKWLETFNG